jgi:hypothetical protein
MEAQNEVETKPPKTTERACEQALSYLSGGGDLNSRPLRPEVESADTQRTDLDGHLVERLGGSMRTGAAQDDRAMDAR